MMDGKSINVGARAVDNHRAGRLCARDKWSGEDVLHTQRSRAAPDLAVHSETVIGRASAGRSAHAGGVGAAPV